MLRAGTAKTLITPPTTASLIGYEFRQQHLPPGNTGPHDPLWARVLVLDNGTDPLAAIVGLDHCILPVSLARQLRRSVARQLGTSPDRVLVCCSHTHSGPYYEKSPWLLRQVCTAAAQAAGLTCPVTVTAQTAPLGLGYNRRVITPDGLRHCWNPQEFPGLNPGPSLDPTCTVVLLRQTNGPRQFLLWNIGAHPVVLGKTSRCVSADWPGRSAELLEQSMPHTQSLFLLGACGDVHPWVATQEDPAQIEPVAQTAAGMVRLLAQATKPATETDTLRIKTKTWHGLDLALWRLGGVWLAAAPVELFSGLSAALRQAIPGPLLLATCANGWTGYWPTRQAFAEGGYEVEAARQMGRKPGDGESLVATLAQLAK